MGKDFNIFISIIIPTCNRSDSLIRALNSLRDMDVQECISLEIIIIDNNSDDDTKYISEKFIKSAHFNIRYVFEKRRGLSYARNRGINEAKGEIIVFIDDDVIVEKEWIAAIFKFVNSGKECGMIFGQTKIYSPDLYKLSTKESDFEEIFESPVIPWNVGNGNNMIIKRSTIKQVGYFDISLGAGTKIGSAEDTDYVHRVLTSGIKIIYSPTCIVYHDHGRILPRQIRKIKYNYAKGRGAFYFKHIIRFDIWALKLFYIEIKNLYGPLKNRNGKELMLNLKGLLYGIVLRLIDEVKMSQ